MRLVQYCDLGDAQEFRVEAVGSVVLISPNVVRVTYLARRPDSKEYGVVAHHFWDVTHYLAAVRACRNAGASIEQQRAAPEIEVDCVTLRRMAN